MLALFRALQHLAAGRSSSKQALSCELGAGSDRVAAGRIQQPDAPDNTPARQLAAPVQLWGSRLPQEIAAARPADTLTPDAVSSPIVAAASATYRALKAQTQQARVWEALLQPPSALERWIRKPAGCEEFTQPLQSAGVDLPESAG